MSDPSMINDSELRSLNRGDAVRYTQYAAYWEIKRLRDELEQAMTVLRDIAGQSKYDELGDQAEEADFEGAYDIMIQLARSVTTKGREQALQDLADNDEGLIDWGDSTRPSPGERQWTPVDAAKPKVGRGVLVWSPSNITTYMACWDGKRFKPWTLGETERAGITHWKPVGDPPVTEKGK